MQVTNTGATGVEQDRLELERRKMALEELKFTYAMMFDEKKLKSERSAKLWSQFAVFTPLLVLIIGFFFNSLIERNRRVLALSDEEKRERRLVIEKQLDEFYYPIDFRLHKDRAVFDFWQKYKDTEDSWKMGKYLEDNVIIPNHDEIIKIIDSHADLIKHSGEFAEDIKPFLDQLKVYERHVAVYKSLINTGDPRKPQAVKEPFPKEFFHLLEVRICDLENQLIELHLSQ